MVFSLAFGEGVVNDAVAVVLAGAVSELGTEVGAPIATAPRDTASSPHAWAPVQRSAPLYFERLWRCPEPALRLIAPPPPRSAARPCDLVCSTRAIVSSPRMAARAGS
jgi:hypothetical protein